MIYIVWASMLFVFLRGIFNRLPIINNNVDIAIALYFIIPVILAIPSLINKFCIADYLFYLFNVFYLLSCYSFFPENTTYLDENAAMCIFCVFTFYFIGRVIDIDQSYNIFLLLSTCCILIMVFYYSVYAQGNKNMEEIAGDDNMYTAYQLLPHVAFLLWSTLNKFRIWKAVVTFLGLIFLLSCGTRGPFVCLGFLGVVYFFFFMKFKGAIYIKISIIILSTIAFINLYSIVLFLAKMFTGMQLSTRILEKILTGELGNDSYRSVLRDKLYDVLNSGDHFWGLGAFGCRNYDIIYPHYLPLDLVCTYGYLLGYILLILLILFIAFAFWLSRGKKSQEFLLFLFSVSIIKLFLSNSFILEPYFFMLIGASATEIIQYFSIKKTELL